MSHFYAGSSRVAGIRRQGVARGSSVARGGLISGSGKQCGGEEAAIGKKWRSEASPEAILSDSSHMFRKQTDKVRNETN